MAKKTVIAAGVVIALAAAFVGASWYTGKQIEQHIEEATNNLNTQLKNAYPQSGIKVVFRDYQRHVFSSQITLVIEPDVTSASQHILSGNDEIVFNTTLFHGPLPMSGSSFSLKPAMAAVHAEMTNTESVKSLFALTNNKPFIIVDSRIDYSGDTHSTFTLPPIASQTADEMKIAFSGTQLQLDMAVDLREARLVGNISNLSVEKANTQRPAEKIVLQDLGINSDTRKGKFELEVGDAKLTLKKLVMDIPNGNNLTLNDFSLTNHSSEDDNNLAGQMAIALGSIVYGEQNLGSLNLNVNFAGLDGNGARQFMTQYRKTLRTMLQDKELGTSAYEQQMSALVLRSLPLLLKGNPSIKVAPLSWKNAKGESTFTLALDLTDPLQKGSQPTSNLSDEEALIRQSVKSLDARLNVPLEMISEAIVQVAPKASSDEEKKQTAQMARQQAQLMANIGQMSQLTVTKDNAITSLLHYSDGVVTFNDQKIPLSNFVAPLINQHSESAPEEDDDAPSGPVDTQSDPSVSP
ncbi:MULTISPECIES: YdgA family protein [Dickeya]|uniref:GTP-binding protein YdgA n=1 Tax=Dickeya aquatica TaxID=1401087 RepID=A0A375AAY4_9GAMM|nr:MULTISPECIES: YdgA family protein [Dickeya]SLM63101.1 Putative GTP-binding protein YdgA [Dickeya aquatica]